MGERGWGEIGCPFFMLLFYALINTALAASAPRQQVRLCLDVLCCQNKKESCP